MEWTDYQISEVIKCTKDPIYCLENYVWMDSDYGVCQFNIGKNKDEDFFYQRDIINALLRGENVVILKSRRAGLSWIAAFISWWMANFHRGWNSILVSRTEKEAISLLKKVKFIHNNLAHKDHKNIERATPAYWLANYIDVDNMGLFAIGHKDDRGIVTAQSLISSSTTTKHTGRGEKAKFVFVDEVQFIENQDEVFGSVLTTAARAGQWMMGSNAGSVGTRFHHLCIKGRAGENKTYYYREVWPWETGIDEDEIEKASEAMPDDVKQQEWYLTFRQPGNAVFDSNHLAACYKPFDLFPDIQEELDKYKNAVKASNGQIYYYSGVDSAVGKVHRKSKEKDWNVFTVLTRSGIQAFTYADQKPLSSWAGQNVESQNGVTVAASGTVSKLHKEWPGLCSIEENGPGLVVLSRYELPTDGFSYYRTVTTNQAVKSRLIKNLMIAIESHSITITDQRTYQELSLFQYGDKPDTYEAPVGFTDDRVMSLAFAWDGIVREGLVEHDYYGGSFDPDAIKISSPDKYMIDLENASVAPAVQWRNVAIEHRLSYMMPMPFEEIEPIDSRYLPKQHILDHILGSKQ